MIPCLGAKAQRELFFPRLAGFQGQSWIEIFTALCVPGRVIYIFFSQWLTVGLGPGGLDSWDPIPPKMKGSDTKRGTLRIPWPTGAPNQQATSKPSTLNTRTLVSGREVGIWRSRPRNFRVGVDRCPVVQWSLLPSTQGPLLQTPPGLEDVKRKELVCNPPRICLEDNFFLLDTWRIFLKHVICVWKLVSEN